jgi:hypothetical protein
VLLNPVVFVTLTTLPVERAGLVPRIVLETVGREVP